MNIYEFMSDSPFLTFFLAAGILETIRLTICRILRHLNIRKHGYPPEHCDADGDFKETEQDN